MSAKCQLVFASPDQLTFFFPLWPREEAENGLCDMPFKKTNKEEVEGRNVTESLASA